MDWIWLADPQYYNTQDEKKRQLLTMWAPGPGPGGPLSNPSMPTKHSQTHQQTHPWLKKKRNQHQLLMSLTGFAFWEEWCSFSVFSEKVTVWLIVLNSKHLYSTFLCKADNTWESPLNGDEPPDDPDVLCGSTVSFVFERVSRHVSECNLTGPELIPAGLPVAVFKEQLHGDQLLFANTHIITHNDLMSIFSVDWCKLCLLQRFLLFFLLNKHDQA